MNHPVGYVLGSAFDQRLHGTHCHGFAIRSY
jgi:hypothetical protein